MERFIYQCGPYLFLPALAFCQIQAHWVVATSRDRRFLAL